MTRIPNEIRNFVKKRAAYRCEYCQIPDHYGLLDFHIEHIVAIKHDGTSEAHNLAYACASCNLAKGTDLGSLDQNGNLIRYFDPRRQSWSDHFELRSDGVINAKSTIGEVTIKMFEMNLIERVEARENLIILGLW